MAKYEVTVDDANVTAAEKKVGGEGQYPTLAEKVQAVVDGQFKNAHEADLEKTWSTFNVKMKELAIASQMPPPAPK